MAGQDRRRGPGLPDSGALGWILGAPLLLFLVLPLVALTVATAPGQLIGALGHPMMASATWLSLRTTFVSLAVIVLTGTPLAWYIARSGRKRARIIESLVELPIVIPPAVVGVALLMAYGRRGLLGSWMADLGWSIPFTTIAVLFAQIVVAAPFFVQTAAAGFRRVDDDLLLVAKTLGATPAMAFLRVAVPAALPALVGGAALAWARALGEFGATLFFAGNLSGRTQTMPLAIYSALEVDLELARALALVLAAAAFAVLLILRLAPALSPWRWGGGIAGRTAEGG